MASSVATFAVSQFANQTSTTCANISDTLSTVGNITSQVVNNYQNPHAAIVIESVLYGIFYPIYFACSCSPV